MREGVEREREREMEDERVRVHVSSFFSFGQANRCMYS